MTETRQDDPGERAEVLQINYMKDGRWRVLFVQERHGLVGATQLLEGRPGVEPGDLIRFYRVGKPPKLRFDKVG